MIPGSDKKATVVHASFAPDATEAWHVVTRAFTADVRSEVNSSTVDRKVEGIWHVLNRPTDNRLFCSGEQVEVRNKVRTLRVMAKFMSKGYIRDFGPKQQQNTNRVQTPSNNEGKSTAVSNGQVTAEEVASELKQLVQRGMCGAPLKIKVMALVKASPKRSLTLCQNQQESGARGASSVLPATLDERCYLELLEGLGNVMADPTIEMLQILLLVASRSPTGSAAQNLGSKRFPSI